MDIRSLYFPEYVPVSKRYLQRLHTQNTGSTNERLYQESRQKHYRNALQENCNKLNQVQLVSPKASSSVSIKQQTNNKNNLKQNSNNLSQIKEKQKINMESSINLLYEAKLFTQLASQRLNASNQFSQPNPRLHAEAAFLYRLWEFINQEYVSLEYFITLVDAIVDPNLNQMPQLLSHIDMGKFQDLRLQWTSLQKISVPAQHLNKQNTNSDSNRNANQELVPESQRDRLSKYYPPVRKMKADQCENLISRLYNPHYLHRREQLKQEHQMERLNKQLQKCTFKPVLSNNEMPVCSNNQMQSPQVHGYENTINRLREANRKNQQHKKKLEHIPRGQKYEKLKNMDFKVPTFLQRQKGRRSTNQNQSNAASSRELLFFIQFQLKKKRPVKVNVHKGESPSAIAENVGRIYSLNRSTIAQIQGVVERELYNYYQRNPVITIDDEEYDEFY